ncbi:MAG: Holliday junction resolvase RuvX [Planctomycetaceae bacterium]
MARSLLALDYGRKRIGIAIATALGTVHPRPRLERTTRPEDLRRLADLAREIAAEAIVLGLPHNMDGSTSGMEEEVRAFAMVVAVECRLPVFGVDERLSTEAAESALRAQHLGFRERKERRDSAAACLLLQDFLDAGEEGERLA